MCKTAITKVKGYIYNIIGKITYTNKIKDDKKDYYGLRYDMRNLR